MRFPAADLLSDARRQDVLATIAAAAASSTAFQAVPLLRDAEENVSGTAR